MNLGIISLSIFEKPLKLELIDTFEFNSDRKRMSVVLRNNSKYYLFTKGADNIMLDRIASSENLDYTIEKLDIYSKVGLRILVFGKREISGKDWMKFHELKQSLLDSKEREKAICNFCSY